MRSERVKRRVKIVTTVLAGIVETRKAALWVQIDLDPDPDPDPAPDL